MRHWRRRMLTNHLMTSPIFNNLIVCPFISLESIHFMPDISMNQVTAIIRSPLLMAATANALGRRYSNIIIKVLMPLDFTDATHNSLILAALINKQTVAKIIQTFFFYRMMQSECVGWSNVQVVNVS